MKIDALEDELFSNWQNFLEPKGVSWPLGEARRLGLLALYSNINKPMSQDDIAGWVQKNGGRYDRQARHLAADGWYIVSGNTRSTRMEISKKMSRDQLMLVSFEIPNPIFIEQLTNSRKWDMTGEDWAKKLKVFSDAKRGCAICGRHFEHYDKGHLDIKKSYSDENIVPNCVECNNWAQARKVITSMSLNRM